MRLDMSAALRDPGQSYPFSCEVTLPPMEYLSDPVAFHNVKIEGELVGTGEGVAMHARVEADCVSRCARCLEEARLHIEAEIENRFSRTPADEDEYLIEGYKAEIDQCVQDALVLEMPIRFLCKPDCKGLCPVCGRNRNIEECGCAREDELED